MLMWQDQRGTDHSFEIIEPRRRRVHDVRRAARHPADRQRPVARPHPPLPARPARRARAHRGVPRGDGLRRPPGSPGAIAANQCTSFMVAAAATTARSARPRTTTSWCALAGVDATRLPPLVAVDERDRRAAARRRGRARPARAARSCTPAINDSHAGAVATGAFAPGRAGLAIGTTACWSTRVADFGTDLDHEILSMPSPFVDRTSCARRTASAARCVEHVLERVVYADDELGDHRVDDPFAALDAAARRDRAGRGRRAVPALARGSLAPERRAGRCAAASSTCRSTPSAPTSCARSSRASRHNLAWLLPARRGVHRRARSTRSCSSAARPARRSGARCSPTCSTGPVAPLARPATRRSARATALLALQRARRARRRRPRPRMVDTTGRVEPRARAPRHLRAATQTQFRRSFEAAARRISVRDQR